jgi:hypothetical protein
MSAQEDVKHAAIDRFISLEGQFLSALGEVFPECPRLKSYTLQFQISSNLQSQREQRIQEWIEYMVPLASAVAAKDATVVMQNKNFPIDIDIEKKYNDADVDDATREVTWQYLNELTNLAMSFSIYNSVPDQMLSKITAMAEGLAENMQQGGGGLDLNQIQQQVSSMISPQEMEEFGRQMQSADMSFLQQQLMGAMANFNPAQLNGTFKDD